MAMKTNHEKVEMGNQSISILLECEKWQTDEEIDELSNDIAKRLLENGTVVDFQVSRSSPKELIITVDTEEVLDQRQYLKNKIEQHFISLREQY